MIEGCEQLHKVWERLPFSVYKVRDKSFVLIFYKESNGTQSPYNLLGLILPVLDKTAHKTIVTLRSLLNNEQKNSSLTDSETADPLIKLTYFLLFKN